MTYNPTLRLLAVLEVLQSRAEVSSKELARRLEVEERTVRRYIMMLRDMGIPIDGERGRHGGYTLQPGFHLRPLMFNAEEITAVMMGLMVMRELGATSLLSVESAATKIERVLPAELRQTTDALREAMILDHVQIRTYSVSSEWPLTVSRAAHLRLCLDIVYTSGDGETAERRIAPYGLVLHARTWYMPAYCFLRNAMRLFRLDRVATISAAGEQFTRPDDFDAKVYVMDSLARLGGIYAFEVILHTPLAIAREVVPPSLAVLESEGEATLMRCYSDDPHWFARYLTRLELPFTVRAPDELREALRALAEEILAGI
jgi:predicted DNA-binding transcriptional regulator YafY